MNQIAPLRQGQVPAAFASRANLPDMNAAARAGVAAGFAVLGYKGRNWRLKHAGNEELLKDARGVPTATLEVVIVGVSPAISKIWYEKKYSEGDDAAPDCWSVNGVTPDATAPKLQASTCAACPRNVWGSRVTDAGKKAKECQDSRRLAVVPADDIENADYGGPILLRVPPMSLANLSAYAVEIGRFGAQPFMVRTELGFDYDVAYPHLTFKALGFLTDDEARQVVEAMEHPIIERILSDEVVTETAAPATDASSPLAGGPPAHVAKMVGTTAAAPTAPPRDFDAEREQEARIRQGIIDQNVAQAEQARLLREQQEAEKRSQEAAATREAEQAAQAAPTPAKKGFGAKKTPVTGAAAPVEQAAAATAPARPTQAPDDMEAAIDALLN